MPIAIVLSGGASKGDFEVGAVRYLYDHQIRPDILCGTSVGAINAVKLAEGEGAPGQGLSGLEQIWLSLRQSSDMYLDAHWYTQLGERLRRIVDGQAPGGPHSTWVSSFFNFLGVSLIGDAYNCDELCTELKNAADLFANETPKSRYDLTPIRVRLSDPANLDPAKVSASGIKLRLAAVSLESGELAYVDETAQLLGRGGFGYGVKVPLLDAVMASAALPFAFAPVQMLGATSQEQGAFGWPVSIRPHWYVDGGAREVLPVQAAVDAGADRIYAIWCSPRLGMSGTPVKPAASHPGLNFPPPPGPPTYQDASIINIAYRSIDILADENVYRSLNPAGGRAASVTLIGQRSLVHDGLTIDPGLIRIALDYGYLRAFLAVEQPGNQHLDDALEWLIECRISASAQEAVLASGKSPVQGRTLAEYARGMRASKVALQAQIEDWIGSGGLPRTPYSPDFAVWIDAFEAHKDPLPLATPWDACTFADGSVIAAATPPDLRLTISLQMTPVSPQAGLPFDLMVSAQGARESQALNGTFSIDGSLDRHLLNQSLPGVTVHGLNHSIIVSVDGFPAARTGFALSPRAFKLAIAQPAQIPWNQPVALRFDATDAQSGSVVAGSVNIDDAAGERQYPLNTDLQVTFTPSTDGPPGVVVSAADYGDVPTTLNFAPKPKDKEREKTGKEQKDKEGAKDHKDGAEVRPSAGGEGAGPGSASADGGQLATFIGPDRRPKVLGSAPG